MTATLGLDIGGANLKAATSGEAQARPFALWKEPDRLPDALRELLAEFPAAERLAVTMTGELCDCYATKREGVAAILDAVEAVAAGRRVLVWQTDGRFVSPGEARKAALLAASANWHALATFVGRLAPKGPALLIDVGSTTTDVIPLRDGKPAARGLTDPDRMRNRELVYVGVRRTPLCALLGTEVAAELFATTLDVFLLLGKTAEDVSDRDTADGRPATRAAAHARMARMLCADGPSFSQEQARKLAERVLLKLVFCLGSAIEHAAAALPSPPTVILAGSGEFLAWLVLQQQQFPVGFTPREVISLGERLGPSVSSSACAHAVAVLASERVP